MKTTAMIVAAGALLAGCATGRDGEIVADPSFDAVANEFTGWVRVSEGEFQLFREQRQLREPFSRPCVSGALPRNAQRAAADLNGTQATFTGRAAAWPQPNPGQTLVWQGSRIRNLCRGAFVIQADSVRVLR